MSDWIKLHRKIQDNPYWLSEPFTRGQAWVDILLLACWKGKSFYIRGNLIKVSRGQFAYSERFFCERWLWSRNKVRRFFDSLSKSKNVIQQKSKLCTLTTVVNYDKYQAGDTTDDTTERPQKDHNKKKKVKKVKKKHIHGTFKNVLLTEEEHKKLHDKFNSSAEKRIEDLSYYLGSTGKVYKDHYRTILSWARNEKNKSDGTPDFMRGVK